MEERRGASRELLDGKRRMLFIGIWVSHYSLIVVILLIIVQLYHSLIFTLCDVFRRVFSFTVFLLDKHLPDTDNYYILLSASNSLRLI